MSWSGDSGGSAGTGSRRAAGALALLALLGACGGDGEGGADGSTDAPTADSRESCAEDEDCSDGVFCNGVERCAPSSSEADAAGCVPAPEGPCMAGQTCHEGSARCLTECELEGDADGDGHQAASCGGDDCDDSDPNRYPGNTEVCDSDDHDEDCDPTTFGFRDLDTDGSPDDSCCNEADDGTRHCGTDCDDANPTVSRTNTETCDGVDNDCDGEVDEGVVLTFYRDADGDGFGDPEGETREGCAPPTGFVFNNTDCDDGNMGVHPGAYDRCDMAMVDDDCDGTPNNPPDGCACETGESRACAACPGPDGDCVGECAGSTQDCVDGTWSGCSLSPSAETCDGRDEDCDGTTDEGFPAVTYYRDADGDGYGQPSDSVTTCGDRPSGYVSNDDDCYDGSPEAKPGQTAWFTTNRGDGSFDYDCDGMERRRYEMVNGCCRCATAGSPHCAPSYAWEGSTVPGCGETASFVAECTGTCSTGGTCADASPCTPAPESRTQECL